VVAPVIARPVNEHDTTLLPESIRRLAELAERTGVPLAGAALTLDSGFDSRENKALLREAQLAPIVYPNRRNTKEPIAIARLFRWFQRRLYRERYRIERTFAWEDTYRKLATSYDRLPETRLGFRYLAYTMMNFRVTFSASTSYSL